MLARRQWAPVRRAFLNQVFAGDFHRCRSDRPALTFEAAVVHAFAAQLETVDSLLEAFWLCFTALFVFGAQLAENVVEPTLSQRCLPRLLYRPTDVSLPE